MKFQTLHFSIILNLSNETFFNLLRSRFLGLKNVNLFINEDNNSFNLKNTMIANYPLAPEVIANVKSKKKITILDVRIVPSFLHYLILFPFFSFALYSFTKLVINIYYLLNNKIDIAIFLTDFIIFFIPFFAVIMFIIGRGKDVRVAKEHLKSLFSEYIIK